MEGYEAILKGIAECPHLTEPERRDYCCHFANAVAGGRVKEDSARGFTGRKATDVGRAFCWANQPEGVTYWSNLQILLGDCKRYMTAETSKEDGGKTWISSLGFTTSPVRIDASFDAFSAATIMAGIYKAVGIPSPDSPVLSRKRIRHVVLDKIRFD